MGQRTTQGNPAGPDSRRYAGTNYWAENKDYQRGYQKDLGWTSAHPTSGYISPPPYTGDNKVVCLRQSSRPDDAAPFAILHSRPFNTTVDAKYHWGSLHYLSRRETNNTITPRVTACIAIGQVHSGTGTGLFYSLSTGYIMKTNHSKPMPFSPDVVAFLKSIAIKDQWVTIQDPYFQFHGAELQANLSDDTTTEAQDQTPTHGD